MPSIRRSHLLIALAVVLAAVGLFFIVRAMSGAGGPAAAPSPSEASSPATPDVAQPRPFKVEVTKSRGVAIDNSNLYGRKAPAQPAVVKAATQRAVAQLERYLNSQFISGEARFSTKPLRKLLTLEAFKGLTKADRAALGVASLKPRGGGTSTAKARSVVLHLGNDAYGVTLNYRAKVELLLDSKPQALIQEGTMVFASGKAGWRADMVDVRLSLPPAPKSDTSEKKPATASEEATP